MRRPDSLKARVMRSVSAVAVLAWIALTAALVVYARMDTDERFDDSLRELAHIALAFAEHELEEIEAAGGSGVGGDNVSSAREGNVVYQIWRRDGQLAYRSQRAPKAALAPDRDGLDTVRWDGRSMRSYTQWNGERSFQVQMVELPQRRALHGLQLSAAIFVGLLVALGGMLWLIRRQLDLAFTSLDEAAGELGRKSAADLTPVATRDAPAEMAPVLASFNALLQRVGAALHHERRFTSDAAHELRTPLATLKLLAHNVRHAGEGSELGEALAQMDRAIARSAAVVDQILALSRYDRDPSGIDLAQAVDLGDACRLAADELRRVAAARRIDLRLGTTPRPPTFTGNRDAVAVALRNLLHNALLYTPPGGRVETVIQTGDDIVELEVHDSGPGITPALRERVFARFHRIDPGHGDGSGLGLALVQRIVELHGATVAIETSPQLGGALVRVRWPRTQRG